MRRTLTILLLTSFKICHGKPLNVILLIADDMGWNDVSFHGSNQIFTPNIDALAYNGIVLNNFYTQPTCTPSRAALLTGKYPMRIGFQGYPTRGGEDHTLPLTTPTLIEQLKGLGYKTHLVGKWHLGYTCRKNTPPKRGFDSFFGYYNGFIGYNDYTMEQKDFVGYDFRNDDETFYDVRGRYALDVLTERSVEIIERHNTDEPLFLMVSHLAPHTGESGTELTVKNQTEVDIKFSYIKDENRRRYADIVEKLDESVGKIVMALSRANLLENSVVFFLSDNGGQTYGLHHNMASNWPLKGLKFTILNGGIHVPSLVYSPILKKRSTVNDGLIHITDLFKTVYRIAGGDLTKLTDLDSEDIWESLIEGTEVARKELLLEIDEVRNISGIIDGNYKLIQGTFDGGIYDNRTGETGRGKENPPYDVTAVLNSDVNKAIELLQTPLDEGGILKIRNRLDLGNVDFDPVEFNCVQTCLFNLESDLLESKNVANEHTEIISRLSRKIEHYRQFLIPRGNSVIDINSNPDLFNGTWSSWLESTEKCL